jgi:hypothetical protein
VRLPATKGSYIHEMNLAAESLVNDVRSGIINLASIDEISALVHDRDVIVSALSTSSDVILSKIGKRVRQKLIPATAMYE